MARYRWPGSLLGAAARLTACRVAMAMLVLSLAYLPASPPVCAQQPSDTRIAVLLDIRGAIGPATTEYLRQGFETAVVRDAALIILRIDTPGGLADAMHEIIRDMLASPIPIVAYVAPSGARAASAGTYILYASQLAAMAPGTNLGAATPVQLGGGFEPLPGDSGGEDAGNDGGEAPVDAMTAKIVNDAVAYIRGLADLHGRNADWAESAVRQAASLPAREALDRHVIELIATNLDDLLAQADGRSVHLADRDVTLDTGGLAVVALEPDWRVEILSVLTDPNIAYILMLIGTYGIIFEFLNPGAIFPGVIGGISLLVALFALNLMPIDLAGAGLLLLGIALMTAEAFVPSFGVLGIGGIAAFALGSLFMFETAPGFALSPAVVVTATVASVVLLIVALTVVLRAHRRQVVSGDAVIIGATGVVLAWSGTSGDVRVHGERWRARADAPLGPGAQVCVTARESLVLTVEPLTHPAPEP